MKRFAALLKPRAPLTQLINKPDKPVSKKVLPAKKAPLAVLQPWITLKVDFGDSIIEVKALPALTLRAVLGSHGIDLGNRFAILNGPLSEGDLDRLVSEFGFRNGSVVRCMKPIVIHKGGGEKIERLDKAVSDRVYSDFETRMGLHSEYKRGLGLEMQVIEGELFIVNLESCSSEPDSLELSL